MKNRILCIALAICLLAAVFVALPTKGAINHTGSVRTMDSTGHPQNIFFAGDSVYFNATLYERGVLDNGYVRVEMQRPDGSAVGSPMTTQTNNPAPGCYNSTLTSVGFTAPPPSGPVSVFYVVTYENGNGTFLASVPITVRAESLTLTPNPTLSPYYPGEEVTITWVTTSSSELFFMHVINATGVTYMNWSRQSTTEDGWWSAVWKIDANIPDGTYRIRARDESGPAYAFLSVTIPFEIRKYTLTIDPERTHYMPGEVAKITYLVYETATFMPYSGATITYSSDWLNSTGNKTWLNNSLAGDSGVQEFTIPTAIALYSDINITYWANESSRSDSEHILLVLDQLSATLDVNAGPYMPGDTVVAEVKALVGPDNLTGASVGITVERNGTDVPAYAASGLMTDLQGNARHAFVLADASAQDGYIVTAVVTKAGYTVTKKASFYVVWTGSLTAKFDKDFYFSGDTASVSFKAIWNNQLLESPSIGYQVYAETTLLSTGNSTGADISVSIPSDYSGDITVEAMLNYQGNILVAPDATVKVYSAALIVTAEKETYVPGDTVTFDYEVVTGLSSVSLSYKVKDAAGVIVATGDLTGMSGSFDFDVPTENPSASYTAEVTMKDAAGMYETADATAYMELDDVINIWTGKSGYSSGEFKPGQTVKVHYSINAYVNEPLPIYTIALWDGWTGEEQTYQVTEATGVLSFELPKDVPQGELAIFADLRDPVTPDDLSSDVTKIVINSQLSGWDKSVAGMSAISFTLLLLIVIMILLLIILPFLKGRMGAPKAAEPAKVEPPPPSP